MLPYNSAGKLLSICIPTYNRANFLNEALNSIVGQLNDDLKQKIEIVVCDNASHDFTGEVVQRLQVKYPGIIKYHRNNQNIGFDANVLAVVDQALGEYCCLFGDDDKFVSGAIEKLLDETIDNQKVALFLFDRENWDFAFAHQMRYLSALNIQEAKVFDFNSIEIIDYLKLVNKLTGIFSYISSIVFKRQAWQDVSEKQLFVGSGYIHVYMFMSLLWAKKRILKYIPEKYVQTRWGNDRSFDSTPGLALLFARIKMDICQYHAIAQRTVQDQLAVRSIDRLVLKNDAFSWIVKAKISCGIDFYLHIFPFLLSFYWTFPLFWAKVVPLLFVPAWLVVFLRWGYQKYVKREVV